MNTQDRIAEFQALINDLDAEEKTDTKETRKALEAAAATVQEKATPMFSNLKVSWIQDFEPVELAFEGEMDETTLRQSFRGLPRACERKLQAQINRPAVNSPRAIKADFRRRHEAREGKRAEYAERMRRLQNGTADA